MIVVTAKQLWEDYCYYLAMTGNFKQRQQQNEYLRVPKSTPERLALMERLRKWCELRELPARQWLFSLFAIRRWMFGPQLKPGYLCSENHLKKFKTFTNYDLYTQRIRAQASSPKKRSEGYDPNRDISNTAEESKQYYVNHGQFDLCMARMHTETFGFHPKSSVCVTCPQGAMCLATLQKTVAFDIAALRRGDITSEQAYAKALGVGQGYGRA